jgi:hypothetical protein
MIASLFTVIIIVFHLSPIKITADKYTKTCYIMYTSNTMRCKPNVTESFNSCICVMEYVFIFGRIVLVWYSVCWGQLEGSLCVIPNVFLLSYLPFVVVG